VTGVQTCALPIWFILKLDPPEFRHLARNEWLMLQAAGDSGLSTATAQLVRDRDGLEALAVQRFDRTPDGGLLAVEDACQVTGRYPADKYQLSTEEACVGLATTTDAPVVAGRTLLRWVTFGYLAGNGDLHAKNLAVAERADGTVLPAPVYDVPSTYPYGDVTMALRVNGKIRDDIGREDLMAFAARLGVPARAAGKVLDDVAGRTDLWLGSLTESGFDRRTVHKWTRLVLHRRDRVAAGAARTAE
jgi:serine/threonine-protein kinase HipA